MIFTMPGQARHIAIIMHDFSTGGSERIAIRLANQWARQGRRVTILCGTMDGPARSLVDTSVTIVAASPQIRRSAFSRIALGFALAESVAALDPDILFSPGNFHIPVLAALGLKLGKNRPPFVCKLSNPIGISMGRAIQHLFSRLMAGVTGAVDVFIAMSHSLRDEAASVLPARKIQVISEPNIDAHGSTTRVDRDPAAPALIVCAGRLVAQKNFALALRAFALLGSASNARLLILGDGVQKARLTGKAARLGILDRVRFAGHVADIRPELARASLFLLSSRYEGYPAVLIEALAAGLPVIATDCSPAIGEILCHSSFGRVAAPDPQQMADAIHHGLQAAPPDPAEVALLVKRHRIDVVADQYLDLFDVVVRTRNSSLSAVSPPWKNLVKMPSRGPVGL